MNAPGHLSVAYLLSRRQTGLLSGRERLDALAPALCGALLPDITDKLILYMRLSPYGRTIGHSLALWVGLTLLWGAWRACARRQGVVSALAQGREPLTWALLGGWSHLGADLLDDIVDGLLRAASVFSAWWAWPLGTPDDWHVRVTRAALWSGSTTPLEWAAIAAAVWSACRGRRGE